jgi:hypothetical protein
VSLSTIQRVKMENLTGLGWRGKLPIQSPKRVCKTVFQKQFFCFLDRSLPKVGVEGSNPFARSNNFNALGDRAFAAQSGGSDKNHL